MEVFHGGLHSVPWKAWNSAESLGWQPNEIHTQLQRLLHQTALEYLHGRPLWSQWGCNKVSQCLFKQETRANLAMGQVMNLQAKPHSKFKSICSRTSLLAISRLYKHQEYKSECRIWCSDSRIKTKNSEKASKQTRDNSTQMANQTAGFSDTEAGEILLKDTKQLRFTSTDATKANLSSPLGQVTDIASVRAHTRILYHRTVLLDCCLPAKRN